MYSANLCYGYGIAELKRNLANLLQPGRSLLSFESEAAYAVAEVESLDMTPLVTTSNFLRKLHEAPATAASGDAMVATIPKTHKERMTSMLINPTLTISGKPAAVLPLQVVWTDWEGHDTTDVATCLSGALLRASDVSLLVSPAVLASSHGPQEEAAGLADQLAGALLPNMLRTGGSAAVFVSSMYQSGPKLSARELKAALTKHYPSLVKLPSCLTVPEAAALWVRKTVINIVTMVTGTSYYFDGQLEDHKAEFLSMAEAKIEVDEVLNEKHPELCAGIQGRSFKLRFAGFSGASSLSIATPTHIWVYAAVEEAVGMCNNPPTA
jgi:hypothetical protein